MISFIFLPSLSLSLPPSLPLSLSLPPSHTPTAPTAFTQSIDTEPMLSILREAKDTLFCDVSSDPGSLLQFSWTKDDQPLVVDGTRLRYIDSSLRRSGSINITRVLNEDAGVYVCTVTTTYNGLPAPTIRTQPSQVVVTGMCMQYYIIM